MTPKSNKYVLSGEARENTPRTGRIPTCILLPLALRLFGRLNY